MRAKLRLRYSFGEQSEHSSAKSAGSAREILKLMALQEIYKSFTQRSRRNTQSSQSNILRRFTLMRPQSLTTLFLRLCFSHLKSSYIRGRMKNE
jgi:hypothetical protein